MTAGSPNPSCCGAHDVRFLGEADIDTVFLDSARVPLGWSIGPCQDAVQVLGDPKTKPTPPATLQVSEPTFIGSVRHR